MRSSAIACATCGSTAQRVWQKPWPRFRHADFKVFGPPPLEISVCENCGAIGAGGGENLRPLFEDADYVFRQTPVHMVRIASRDLSLPAPDYQVSLLAGGLPANPAILDVGCHDGRLLRAFARIVPSASLAGFDVSPQTAELIAADNAGITYVSGKLHDQNFREQFDLIALSHSIQYERDISGLMETLRAALKPNGRLFVQVPDIERKPSSLLLADLHHHFTRDSLKYLFCRHGFAPVLAEAEGFPRDILMLGTLTDPEIKPAPKETWHVVEEAFDYLSRQAEQVEDLGEQGNWCILGTTIDAAFASALLGERAVAFVDERVTSAETFHGKPVFHPHDLKDDDRTILPFGPSATVLLERFRERYRGSFTLV